MKTNVKVNILGTEITQFSKNELIKKVSLSLKKEKHKIIFTPNPSIVLDALKNKKTRKILNSADILIPDGIGLIHASRILRHPLDQRIPGIEFAEEILRIAERNNLSVFLLGSTNETSARAAKKLKERFPRLNIAGRHNGYFDIKGSENDSVLKKIIDASPDILFVCMGSPKQERWIYLNSRSISSLRLSIGLGGSLDVWSGKLKRAPLIIRNIQLEWLWRMIIDPKRFKKISDIPKFYFFVFCQRKRERSNKKSNGKIAHIS